MTTETKDGIIVEYNPVSAALSELREKYAGVLFPVDTKDGMKDAKDVRSKLVKLRTGLEAVRKEIKEPALRRTQAIDAEAKAITNAIREIEEPIDAQIKAEEQRIEAEKAAKAAAEAEVKGKIDGIRALPLALAGCSYAEIIAEMGALEEFVPVEEVFGEQIDDCRAAIQETLSALDSLALRVKEQEEAAARVEEERLRLAEEDRLAKAKIAAEREALDAERKAYEAEKAAFEAQRLAQAEALAVAPSGAETAPVDETEVMPEIEVTAERAAEVFKEAPAEPVTANESILVTQWRTRRVALATAAQFDALAEKVGICGVHEFANDLRNVAIGLREGNFDAILATADSEALVDADTSLLDATVNCIDAFSEEEKVAA